MTYGDQIVQNNKLCKASNQGLKNLRQNFEDEWQIPYLILKTNTRFYIPLRFYPQ